MRQVVGGGAVSQISSMVQTSPLGQSEFVRQATQVLRVVSQTGVPVCDAQSALVLQDPGGSTQTFAMQVPFGHSRVERHCTQVPVDWRQ